MHRRGWVSCAEIDKMQASEQSKSTKRDSLLLGLPGGRLDVDISIGGLGALLVLLLAELILDSLL